MKQTFVVLIVEDNLTSRDAMINMLERYGYKGSTLRILEILKK